MSTIRTGTAKGLRAPAATTKQSSAHTLVPTNLAEVASQSCGISHHPKISTAADKGVKMSNYTEPREVQLQAIYKASDPYVGHHSDFIEGALDAIDGYAAEQYPLYSEPLSHEAYHAGYAFGQSLLAGAAA